MAVESSEEKILKVLKVLREKIKDYIPPWDRISINDLISELESELKPTKIKSKIYPSFLIPVEAFSKHSCSVLKNDLVKQNAISFLENSYVSLLSFDGSQHTPGKHFKVNITIVNVGYWYQNYGKNTFGHGNNADVILETLSQAERRIYWKKIEYSFLLDYLEFLENESKVVLFDESFNLVYTLSWDIESRKEMVSLLENILNMLEKRGIIPVAVFHTSAIDIVRTLSILTGKSLDQIGHIPDKIIMDNYLKDGERSSLFEVSSHALDCSEIKLLAFYLKVSKGNIVRVEFPESFRDKADFIHCVILSQAILGEGYPIAMQRAHEWATLTTKDRIMIEEEIARTLKIPIIDMLMTSKLRSKRRPIV